MNTARPALYADVTRLLRRHLGAIRHTGIDRVSLEYARWVHAQGGGLCLKRVARLRRLSRRDWGRFLLGPAQPGDPQPPPGRRSLFFVRALVYRQPIPRGSTVLVLTHSWLGHTAAWRWLERQNCRAVVFIHDLIPIQFPEYSHPRERALHQTRLRNTLRHARGIIVNSRCTEGALRDFASRERLPVPPVLVNPLGHDLPEPDASSLPDRLRESYFVLLGTIEPRKNHLLLLNLWREMARSLGDRMPQLVVIGRRGWECEQVVDMLERCETIHPHLIELNDAPDGQVAALIRGAQALLMPSFAEGFGMPVQEALAWGIPVISTPLPAIKEFAGTIPDYADPHDGARWLKLLADYTDPDSQRRRAQVQRMADFRATTWPDHFRAVAPFLESLP
jgi:glycosyltransferase involved in cell wall biosynthesis